MNKIDNIDNKDIKDLNNSINKLNSSIKTLNLGDYIEWFNSPKKIFFYNFIWGITRGFGMAVGFTIITGLLIYFLSWLVNLNLPVIGDFIAEIVKIVQYNLDGR